MNNKTAKKLRKLCLTQWAGDSKLKSIYKTLKNNYIAIPKNQRGQFKKNLEIVAENVSQLKKAQGIK
jgi:hypothetical protein